MIFERLGWNNKVFSIQLQLVYFYVVGSICQPLKNGYCSITAKRYAAGTYRCFTYKIIGWNFETRLSFFSAAILSDNNIGATHYEYCYHSRWVCTDRFQICFFEPYWCSLPLVETLMWGWIIF